MNIKLILWILGGVVVVGGGAAVVVQTRQKAEVSTPAAVTETARPAASEEAVASPAGGEKSLKDLLALGISQKCTFTQKVENSESSGVVYMAPGKMRGDFTSLAAGTTIQSHMIVAGDTSYVWTDRMAQGVKMSFMNGTTVDKNPNAPTSRGVDADQKLDYSCSVWSADDGQFVLPKNITFTDLPAMMQQVPNVSAAAGANAGAGAGAGGAGAGVNANAGANVRAMQCAACDQMSDAASKAQCKAALGC